MGKNNKEEETPVKNYKPVTLEEEAGLVLKDRLVEEAVDKLGGRVTGIMKESPEDQPENSSSDLE